MGCDDGFEDEEQGFVPPQPVWRCSDCRHEIFVKDGYSSYQELQLDDIEQEMINKGEMILPDEDAPKICPNCGSKNVLTFMYQFLLVL